MDYYDSRYPLEYYDIGEKYVFYHSSANLNVQQAADAVKRLDSGVPVFSNVVKIPGKVLDKETVAQKGNAQSLFDGILTVQLDNGKIVRYAAGHKKGVSLDQKDLPKQKQTVNPARKNTPKKATETMSVEYAEIDETTAEIVGLTESPSDTAAKAAGLTESTSISDKTAVKAAGLTESASRNGRKTSN